ncbi:MAG TPA: DUF87 domain-containing protein [Polyangiaceae bacterium]|nr:DUF87 domain-containing protein [Polyangiaceae bacterium]
MSAVEEVVWKALRGAVRSLPSSAFGLRSHALPTETKPEECVRACARLLEEHGGRKFAIFIGSSAAVAAPAGVRVLQPDAAAAAATAERNALTPERPLLLYFNARSTPGESGLDVLVEFSAAEIARHFAAESGLPRLKEVSESRSRHVLARLEDASVDVLAEYCRLSSQKSEQHALPLLGLLPWAKKERIPPASLAAAEFDKLQGRKAETRLREALDRLRGLSSEEREQASVPLQACLLDKDANAVPAAVRLCEAAYNMARGASQAGDGLVGLTVDLARLLRRGKPGVDSLLQPKDISDEEASGAQESQSLTSPWELLAEEGPSSLNAPLSCHEADEDAAAPSFTLEAHDRSILLRNETPEGLLFALLQTEGVEAYVERGCSALVEGPSASELLTSRQRIPGVTIRWHNADPSPSPSQAQAIEGFRSARKALCAAALAAVRPDDLDDGAEEEEPRGANANAEFDTRRLLFLLDNHALALAARCRDEAAAYVRAYEALLDVSAQDGYLAQAFGTWVTNLDLAFCVGSGRVNAARLLPLHPLRVAHAVVALRCGAEPPPFPPRLGVNYMREERLDPSGVSFVYAFVSSASPDDAGTALAAREGLAAVWHLLRPVGLVSSLRVALVDMGSTDQALEALCERASAFFEEDSLLKDGVHLEVWRASSEDPGARPWQERTSERDAARAWEGQTLPPLASECAAMPRGEGVSLERKGWVDVGSVPQCHLVVRSVATPYEPLPSAPAAPATLPLRYVPGPSGNVAYVEVKDDETLRRYDGLLDALGHNRKRRGLYPSYPPPGAPSTLVEARVARGGWPIEPRRAASLLSYAESRENVVAVLSDPGLTDDKLEARLREIAPGAPEVTLASLRDAVLGVVRCRSFLSRLLETNFDDADLRGNLGLLRAFMLTLEGQEGCSLALSLDSPEGRAWAAAVAPQGAPRRRADVLILQAAQGEDGKFTGLAGIRVVELKARSSADVVPNWERLAEQALQTYAHLRLCFGEAADARHKATLQRFAWLEAGRQHRAGAWEPVLHALEGHLDRGDAPALSIECWLLVEGPWARKTDFTLRCKELDASGAPTDGSQVEVRFRVLSQPPPQVASGRPSQTTPRPPVVSAGSRAAPAPAPAPASAATGAQAPGEPAARPPTPSSAASPAPHRPPAPTAASPPGALASPPAEERAATNDDGMRVIFGQLPRGEPAVWLPNRTDLVNHFNVGITGTMGTGKTQLTKSLLAQLIWEGKRNPGAKGPGILVFDYKGDYQDTASDPFATLVGAKVLEPENLPLNPLRTMRPTSRQMLRGLPREFADTMLAIQRGIGAVQRDDLVQATTACFEAAGIIDDDPASWRRPFPTLRVLLEHVKARKVAKGSPRTILNDLVDMRVFAEADPEDKADNLFDGVHVINLKPLGTMPTLIRAVLSFFMNAFYGSMLRAGEAPLVQPPGASHHLRALRRFVFVDEADDFISLGLPSLKNVMQQGRSFGCGVVLSTQFLHHFNGGDDPLRPLVGTWVLHQMADVNATDVRALFGLPSKAEADGLTSRLASLPKHTSLCRGLSNQGRGGALAEVRDLPFKDLSPPARAP